jgi:hypothetical protein
MCENSKLWHWMFSIMLWPLHLRRIRSIALDSNWIGGWLGSRAKKRHYFGNQIPDQLMLAEVFPVFNKNVYLNVVFVL